MFILANSACNGMDSLVSLVKFALNIIQWVVPIILIVLGTLDLVKAVIAGKEDDIKKNQQTLIKRIIAAVIVFLVPVIVTVLMGWIGSSDWKTCWKNTSSSISGIFQNQGIN